MSDERATAIVTGASRGIGAAIAKCMAKAGYRVIVNYRSGAGAAEAIVRQIGDEGGIAHPLQADVSVRAEVEGMFAEVERTHGFVACVINNAGVTRDTALMTMTDNEWDAVLDTNLRGTYLCSQAALRGMMHLGFGSITNIVSPSGVRGQAGQCNYSASKGGVIAFTKALAREMGRFGIRVNAVCPGLIETEMSDALIKKQGKALLSQIPLARLGRVEDVAPIVRFLASREARYDTGQVIAVDGGLL